MRRRSFRSFRVPVVLVGVVVSLAACSKETITSSATTSTSSKTSALEAGAAPRPSYGPAVLRMQSCSPAAAAAPMRSRENGCEACKPDEHCKRMNVRGRNFGVCQKSTCEKDADCKGALCTCGPPNECVPGNCRGPEDCGGRECAANRGRWGHGRGTFCRTDQDECTTHAECGAGKECVYAGTWVCQKEVPPPPPG